MLGKSYHPARLRELWAQRDTIPLTPPEIQKLLTLTVQFAHAVAHLRFDAGMLRRMVFRCRATGD